MNLSITSFLKYILLLAIGITLLVFAFKGQNILQLLIDLKSANYWWVLLSVMACLIAHILRAARWNMLIEPLGKGTPSLLNTFYAVMIGYLANLAFPRMGEVSRCGIIHKTNKIPLNQLIGTVITERLIDLIMLLFTVAIAIFSQYQLIASFIYNHLLVKLTDKFSYALVLVVGGSLMVIGLLFFYIIIKKKHWGLVKKGLSLWSGFNNGLRSVKKIDNKQLFIIYSIVIWFFYFLSSYLCLFALTSLSHLGLAAALSILVFGSLGMIAPVQGGIGAFHWIVAEGLTMYAISRSDGLAYATIMHSSQTVLVLIVGLISVILVMIHSSKELKKQ